eukprot:gene18436-biopygen11459
MAAWSRSKTPPVANPVVAGSSIARVAVANPPASRVPRGVVTPLLPLFSIVKASQFSPGQWEFTRFGSSFCCQSRQAKHPVSHATDTLLHRLDEARLVHGCPDSGAGVARAWRGRGVGYRHFLAWGGAGVARAWRGHGAG